MTEKIQLAATSLSTLASAHPLPSDLAGRRAPAVSVRTFVLEATVFNVDANRIAAEARAGEGESET